MYAEHKKWRNRLFNEKGKDVFFVKNSMIRRIAVVVSVLLAAVLLCGCTPFDSEVSDLLRAPKLTGEMQPVQKALEQSLTGNYTLVFPSSGEYRSAIIMRDIDVDGVNEAVAFYSTTIDNTVNIHIAVVDQIDGKWTVTSQQNLVGSDVERVMFDDLDSDGTQEILVGWNIYGNVDKKLCVYEYKGSSMITILSQSYTSFITCDLNDDFSKDILVLNLNTTTALSQASYYSVSENEINEIGRCSLDGSVTAYYDPVVSKTNDGRFCVYIDAAKGAGLITEMIYFEDGILVNPFYDPENPAESPTLRTSIVTSKDFDGDGIVEVPIMTALPVEAQFSVNEQAYLTTWSVFNGNEFVPKLYTLLNYNDGYYLNLEKEQTDKITVVRDTEKRQRTVFEYDYKNNKFGKELCHIRAVTKASFKANNYAGDGYIKLGENEALVYLLNVSDNADEYGFSEEEIKKTFTVIREE